MEVHKIGMRVWFNATRPFSFPALGARRARRHGGRGADLPMALGRSRRRTRRRGADARRRQPVERLLRLPFRRGRPHRGRRRTPGTIPGEGNSPARKTCSGFILILSVPLAPMGAILIRIGGWPVAAIAAVGLFGAYAYTGPPFALKYRRLGELCIFIVYGPAVVVGAGYMQAMKVTPKMLLYSVPLGMLITAIVSANNLRDIEEDGSAKVRTLACALGRKIYLTVYLALMSARRDHHRHGRVRGRAPMAAPRLAGAAPRSRARAPRPAQRPPARRGRLTAKYMTAFGGLIFGAILAGAP